MTITVINTVIPLYMPLPRLLKNPVQTVKYTAVSEEMNVNGLLGNIKYKLKSKTQTGERVELTIEVKIKKNDVSYVSRFNEIAGVESVTMLEYSGEYMN